MKLATSITINKPLVEVFDAFTDIAHRHNYVQGLDRVEGVDRLSVIGDSWREYRSLGGNEVSGEYTVTEFIPKEKITVANESSGLVSASTYKFVQGANANETLVSLSVITKGSGLFGRIVSGLFSTKNMLFEQMLQQELLAYKKVLEEQ